eukprot:CAMPEP_0173343904 /NCGR_PEP_ID=MMETSP1144-20121109/11043_1 /TAXON_ID=483371 /ORGANISM="non described non described, Strain CCMP2298" /LENGTH=159 /DNA_ID=CAMNT_0014290703 /DNA_START=133 /DNA_END=612 /DNA_ORIENTATION=-
MESDDDYVYEEEDEYAEYAEEQEEQEEQEQLQGRSDGEKRHSLSPSQSSEKRDRDKERDRGTRDLLAVSVPSDSYSILDVSDVSAIMRALVADVAGLLDVPADVAQALLQAMKWDKERLIDAFFSDTERIMKGAGLDQYSARADHEGGGTGPVLGSSGS